MNVLNKSESVLKVEEISYGFVYFTSTGNPDIEPDREIRIREGDWKDMGKPGSVTVTIEPGDKLNGPADSPKEDA